MREPTRYERILADRISDILAYLGGEKSLREEELDLSMTTAEQLLTEDADEKEFGSTAASLFGSTSESPLYEDELDEAERACAGMECQLQLLRAFLAVQRADEAELLSAVRDVQFWAALHVSEDIPLAGALFEGCAALARGAPFELARVCVVATQYFYQRGCRRLAEAWIERTPTEDVGVLCSVRDRWKSKLQAERAEKEEHCHG